MVFLDISSIFATNSEEEKRINNKVNKISIL